MSKSFDKHFDRLLTESEVKSLSESIAVESKRSIKFASSLGQSIFSHRPVGIDDIADRSPDFLLDGSIGGNLRENLRESLIKSEELSTYQNDLLSIVSNYRDLFYSDWAFSANRTIGDETTRVLAAHVLNHVIESRRRVAKSNKKLGKAKKQRSIEKKKARFATSKKSASIDEEAEDAADGEPGREEDEGESDDDDQQQRSIDGTGRKRRAIDQDQSIDRRKRATSRNRSTDQIADEHPIDRHNQPSSTNLDQKQSLDSDEIDSCADQGFARPKVLILVPFRRMALDMVRTMGDLLRSDREGKKKSPTLLNEKRFLEEFGVEDEEDEAATTDGVEAERSNGKPRKTANGSSTKGAKSTNHSDDHSSARRRPLMERPPDYSLTFRGNIDDCFRLGIRMRTESTLKLYSDFYRSDILIASPLGLRMAIGADGEHSYDYDFLSSVDIVIFDRADVFLMQNWSHVLHALEHLNREPRQARGIDFSRVHPRFLHGYGRYYRQNLIFSSIVTPELRSIFKFGAGGLCSNYEGRVISEHYGEDSTRIGGGKTLNLNSPTISRVIVSMPQAFQKFACSGGIEEEADRRMEFFVQKVLPQYADASMNGILIFVPSYYDFVRLRNYFKKNSYSNSSFVQICEYTSSKKVSRARDLFFHGDKNFLLYTERFHFFRRYKIRGVRHLIFYQLPNYAQFYSELCNSVLDEKKISSGGKKKMEFEDSTRTCSVIYSKFDALKLAGVLGKSKARELLESDKNVHVLVTE